MGIMDWFINRKKTESTRTVTKYKLITDEGGGIYDWDGKLYKSDVIRACIRPKARAIGKLTAKHILDNNEIFKENPDPTIRFLLEEPNPYMTGQMLQEKLTTQLDLNNNAYAYIHRDKDFNPIEIYPVPAKTVELLQAPSGNLYLRFWFKDGSSMTVPYADVIHLRQDFNESNIFGDPPNESLKELMENVSAIDQGIRKAIKNSAIVKWIMIFNQVLKPKDIDAEVERFRKNYMSLDSEGGAVTQDPRYDLKQVEPKNYIPDDKQISIMTQRGYNFFNTNEKIVQSKFTEDEWNAYYESTLEPVALQLSGEYTRKLFTRRKRGHGNKIIFEASNLIYASMKTKLGLVGLVDRGIMSRNEVRKKAFNLPPVEGGDELVMRLDMAPISEGGEEDAKEGGDDEGKKE